MKHSKVVQILSSFDGNELKEFDAFIRSPYFNTNKNLTRIFDAIKKCHPEYPEPKIAKEFLYEKLFPGKIYNEQIMKNLSSAMLQLALEFLGVNRYRNRNRNDMELDILTELNMKRLDNIFASRLKKTEDDLLDSTHMIHPLYYHLHRIEIIKTQYFLARDKQKTAAQNVLRSGDFLIYYFITELSRIAIDMNANTHSYNVQHEKNLVAEVLKSFDFSHIIKYLLDNNYQYSELLNVYYHRLLAITDSTDENYYSYKALLTTHLTKFSIFEMASLLDSLHNITIQRFNDGVENALREEFEVIKLKLEHNTLALRTGGKISMLTFRNVIFSSVRLNEIGWAEEFIEKYFHLVNEESKESVYNHARGILSYLKKDYDTALAHLNRVGLEDPFFISDAKTHMAIIFYEQGVYDSCISVLDSFRHILTNREEFSIIFRNVNLHFINALTALIKAASGSKKEEALLKIKQKIESQKMVNHKGWLLRKVDELMHKQ